MKRFALVVALLMFAFSAVATAQWGIVFQDDFEGETVGAAPSVLVM